MLRALRRAAWHRWLKRGLLALALVTAALLAWHERAPLMAWLSEPTSTVRSTQDLAAAPSAPVVETQTDPQGAKIYSWRDARGVRTFSDQPPAQDDYALIDRRAGLKQLKSTSDQSPVVTPAAPAGRLTRFKIWLKGHWPLKTQA